MSYTVHDDPWLAGVMERPVFRLTGSGEVAEVARHLERHRGFYFVKVPTDRVADVVSLGKLGFAVVDTNVTFELQHEPPAGVIDVGPIAAGEADAVLDIAGSAFRYSRFHLDPQVGTALANRIKRDWIANYVAGTRGDTLFVARAEGRPIGFLAALVSGETAVIDLVAVATDAHGQGAGAALTAAFAAKYRANKRIVGTQVANVPSIRLYTKLGFVLAHSQYVLHLHHT
jgi:GNAT superfamily N-acetyltransferase